MHIHKNVKVAGREDGWTGGERPVLLEEPRSRLSLGWSWMWGPSLRSVPRFGEGCSGMESPARDSGRGSTLDLSGNFVVWSWVRKHPGVRGLMGTGCGANLGGVVSRLPC